MGFNALNKRQTWWVDRGLRELVVYDNLPPPPRPPTFIAASLTMVWLARVIVYKPHPHPLRSAGAARAPGCVTGLPGGPPPAHAGRLAEGALPQTQDVAGGEDTRQAHPCPGAAEETSQAKVTQCVCVLSLIHI